MILIKEMILVNEVVVPERESPEDLGYELAVIVATFSVGDI